MGIFGHAVLCTRPLPAIDNGYGVPTLTASAHAPTTHHCWPPTHRQQCSHAHGTFGNRPRACDCAHAASPRDAT
eukprot:171034-Alexandrium_andersonii.AAC.1